VDGASGIAVAEERDVAAGEIDRERMAAAILGNTPQLAVAALDAALPQQLDGRIVANAVDGHEAIVDAGPFVQVLEDETRGDDDRDARQAAFGNAEQERTQAVVEQLAERPAAQAVVLHFLD